IANKHLIEQDIPGSMVVAIDEPGHDGHLLSVDSLRSFTDERFYVFCVSNRDEAACFDSEGLRLRHARINCVYFGVENDEIGILLAVKVEGETTCPDKADDAKASQSHEFSASALLIDHGSFRAATSPYHNFSLRRTCPARSQRQPQLLC